MKEIDKGDNVIVVKGRKIPHNTVGKVFWRGNRGFGESVGIEYDGKKEFTKLDNVELYYEESTWKEGDKVTLIKEYHAPHYKMGEIYTIIRYDGYLCISPEDKEGGDYPTGSAKGYFKLVKEKETMKEEKKYTSHWGDW